MVGVLDGKFVVRHCSNIIWHISWLDDGEFVGEFEGALVPDTTGVFEGFTDGDVVGFFNCVGELDCVILGDCDGE